jgi:hypothetical protein
MSNEDKHKANESDKPAARQSRDSSLYRDVRLKSGPDDKASKSQSQGTRSARFVINDDPDVIPVNHQAVIDGLTKTLAEIDDKHQQLETLLKSKNNANKLHIAQLKGQIAALKRRKTEIESVLGANHNQLANESTNKILKAKPKK